MQQELNALSERVNFSNHQALTDTQNLLHKELLPKCITRDLKWGVPVPNLFEKLKEKVIIHKLVAIVCLISI